MIYEIISNSNVLQIADSGSKPLICSSDLSCFLGRNVGFICDRYSFSVHRDDTVFTSQDVLVRIKEWFKVSNDEYVAASAAKELINCADGKYSIPHLNMDDIDSFVNCLTVD